MILLLLFEIISITNWRLQNCNHSGMRCNNDVILLLFIIAAQTRTCQRKWIVVFIAVGTLICEPWQYLEQWHFPAVDLAIAKLVYPLFSSWNDHFKVFRSNRLFFCSESFLFGLFLFVFNVGRYGDRRLKCGKILMNIFPFYGEGENWILLSGLNETRWVENFTKCLKIYDIEFRTFLRSIRFKEEISSKNTFTFFMRRCE